MGFIPFTRAMFFCQKDTYGADDFHPYWNRIQEHDIWWTDGPRHSARVGLGLTTPQKALFGLPHVCEGQTSI